jgi:cellulose synthase operon protein C
MTFRRKALVALLGLMLLALVGIVARKMLVHGDAAVDAQAALRRGLVALKHDDPRTARVELMNAIKANPRLPAAHIAQARALLMLGRGNAAQDELDQAQHLGAKPAAIRHLLAHAALLQGRPEDAVREAEATDVDPREAVFAARIAARGYQALERYDEAARAFDRALEIAPDDAPLWADIARFHIATGDWGKAVSATDRAVALAPKSADILTLRALLIREQYGLTASLPWFERALALDPNYIPAIIEMAATLQDAGRAKAALAMTRRALSLAPGLPRAYLLQAILAARAEHYDLARSLLQRTHGALDGQAATRLLRGVLHLQSGNATLAIEQLGPLLDAQPLNLRARLLLARAYYLDRQFGEAEKVLFPLVERADANSYALTLAARIHEALGHPQLAQGFLARAAAPTRGVSEVFRGAGDPGAVASLAATAPIAADPNARAIRAFLQAGQVDAALSRARTVAAANPGAPAAQMMLGDVLLARNLSREAALAYQRAANMRFSEDVALRLVHAWQRAGDPAQAQRVLALYVLQNPANVESLRLVTAYYLAANDAARAMPLLESLRARVGDNDAVLMTNLAWAWIDRGDAAKALPFAARAYRLNPASAVTSDVLGWALFRANVRIADARDLLEKAIAMAPGEPLVQMHLGQVYVATGNKAAARPLLMQAANADGFPRSEEAAKALGAL